jgi:hypothetical protein
VVKGGRAKEVFVTPLEIPSVVKGGRAKEVFVTPREIPKISLLKKMSVA